MQLLAKTLYGLEDILVNELQELGASDIVRLNRAVRFSGGTDLLYRANYCLRTALSVLMPLGEFRIRSKEELVNKSMKINWNRYLDPDLTFSVVPVVNSPLFSHTGYAGLLLKDSIADWFRNNKGRRPSVDSSDPDIIVNLHISNDTVTISLDSSGIPLFKRGYRLETGEAPVNEVLAAGMIGLSGWNCDSSFYDPMCGSGTIALEAALLASNTPPGKFRKSFGFMKWKNFNTLLFENIKKACDSSSHTPGTGIYASDISEDAVNQTIKNAASAGVSDFIKISRCDLKDLKPSCFEGYVIMNPPYGKRIKPEDIHDLYGMVGSSLKHNFPGFRALLITSDRNALKHIGLKSSAKYTLFNGALECTLVRYELYQGSAKKP